MRGFNERTRRHRVDGLVQPARRRSYVYYAADHCLIADGVLVVAIEIRNQFAPRFS
jgi:hypothetical protein